MYQSAILGYLVRHHGILIKVCHDCKGIRHENEIFGCETHNTRLLHTLIDLLVSQMPTSTRGKEKGRVKA